MAAAGTALVTAAAEAAGISHAVVLLTTKISLAVQIATGFVGLQGLTYALPQPHAVLTHLLALETFVQFVELTFYAWFVYRFNLSTMALTRYADWFFTTPTMLLTTIMYFRYQSVVNGAAAKSAAFTNHIPEPDEKPADAPRPSFIKTIGDFVRENKKEVATILGANVFMLAAGALGEVGAISRAASVVLGFGGLAVSFATIYRKFAKDSPVGRALFAILTALWAAYGVAFLFPAAAKNISFNVLDVFAKNFFGVYLYFQVRRIAAAAAAASAKAASAAA
jgi:bacteriorhodopsin